MADLDDFFAKKDRKKPKSSKKFSTSEELAEKLKDKKPEVPKTTRKEAQATQNDGGVDNESGAADQLARTNEVSIDIFFLIFFSSGYLFAF